MPLCVKEKITTLAIERGPRYHFKDALVAVLPYDMERLLAPSNAYCKDNPVGIK